MKTKADRIIDAIFAVANANPKGRCRISFWLAKEEGETAFDVAKRLTKYPYIELSFDHVKSSADNQRVFNIGVDILTSRPEVTP